MCLLKYSLFLALSSDYGANEDGSCHIHLSKIVLVLERGHQELCLCVITLGRMCGILAASGWNDDFTYGRACSAEQVV